MTYAAPQVTTRAASYRAPVTQTIAAPQMTYAAPQMTYAAPQTASYYQPASLQAASSMVAYPSSGDFQFTAAPAAVAATTTETRVEVKKVKAKKAKGGCCK